MMTRAFLVSSFFAACVYPSAVFAQEATGAPATAAAPAPAPAPASAPASAPAPAPASAPAPDSQPSSAPTWVEQLPPEAYRERHGLYGGSLWLEHDAQGLQWPYSPKTGLGVSGSAWVDTGLRAFHAGEASGSSPGLGAQEESGKQFVQQSRILFRATPTYTLGDYFVQAQAELVAAQLAASSSGIQWSADDAWVRFGKWNVFDVLVGRFEAWEIAHYGMGLDLYTLERAGANDIAPDFGTASLYGVSYMFERQTSLGQGAVHVYPTDWLRFEVGLHYGAETNGANTWGARPVGVLDFKWLLVKVGAELRDQTGQFDNQVFETRQQGIGGAIQVISMPYIEFGVHGAYSETDTRDDMGRITTRGTFHNYTLGGFANARVAEDVLVGAGLDFSALEDTNFSSDVNRNDDARHWQTFGAVQYAILKHLFLKAVFGYAVANVNPVDSNVFRNEMLSARLRALLLF